MTDWLDPSAWADAARAARTATTILDALIKMRDRLSRGKKAKRNLDQEVDALRTDLNQLIDLVTKHVASQGKFVEALMGLLRTAASGGIENQVKAHVDLLLSAADSTTRLNEVVATHERRLKAIEASRPRARRRRRGK